MTSVRLKKDKTTIHPSLTVGAIGRIQRRVGMDCYYSVFFPCADQSVEMFDSQFEIILSDAEIKIQNMQIDSAYEVEYYTGPRGGFKSLRYQHKLPKESMKMILDRTEGLRILEIFKIKGIPVKTIIV